MVSRILILALLDFKRFLVKYSKFMNKDKMNMTGKYN